MSIFARRRRFFYGHNTFCMDESVFNLSYQNKHAASKITAGLERMSEAFRALLWEYAKDIGLSPIQIQILIFVAYHEENLCNVSHLAKEFNITKPTVSDAVRMLLKKELIVKIPSPSDRRAYQIALSAAGEKIVEETKQFANPIQEVIEEWSQEEQEQFFVSLSKLVAALNRKGILSVQRTCYRCRFYQKKETHHYCQLMKKDLWEKDIRLDCPEFELPNT